MLTRADLVWLLPQDQPVEPKLAQAARFLRAGEALEKLRDWSRPRNGY